MDLLRIAGADKARVLVIAVDSSEQSLKIAARVRKRFPHLEIVARARDMAHWYQLRDLGVAMKNGVEGLDLLLQLRGQLAAGAQRYAGDVVDGLVGIERNALAAHLRQAVA